MQGGKVNQIKMPKNAVLKKVIDELKAEANEELNKARIAAANAHAARRSLAEYTGKFSAGTSETAIQTALMELYRAKTFSGFKYDLPPTKFCK